jgi:prevent-host-death family protein
VTWALAEAKNRFSEVVRLAISSGPQEISRRGEKVIVLSELDYLKLRGKKMDFAEFLLKKTPNLTDLDLQRDQSPMRDVIL